MVAREDLLVTLQLHDTRLASCDLNSCCQPFNVEAWVPALQDMTADP